MTFYTDSFIAKSFVSHNTAVKQEMLEQIDMPPKIKDKLFLTPELAPMFSAKDEDLLSILGIVTRILDGHGYESDSGAYGHRGYDEDIMFTWVGAAVDIPYKVYKHLGTLGPKLYFFRMITRKKEEDELLNELKFGNFNSRKKQVEDAVIDYLNWFDYCPNADFVSRTIKITIEGDNHDEQALRCIIKLGNLLSHLRGVVQTWETKGTQGSDYSYYIPVIENPDRAITCLKNLVIGHSLATGKTHISIEDIPIIIRTALSTAPVDRFKVFDLLLERKGELITSNIMKRLNFSRPTALRTMTELKVLELVDWEKEDEEVQTSIQSIKLKKEFGWFLGNEFKKLREGFIPEKFGECKEKSPPSHTNFSSDDGEDDKQTEEYVSLTPFEESDAREDIANSPIAEQYFLNVFDRVPKKHENDYNLVGHKKLSNTLDYNPPEEIASIGKYVGEYLINKFLKKGLIVDIGDKWYYKAI